MSTLVCGSLGPMEQRLQLATGKLTLRQRRLPTVRLLRFRKLLPWPCVATLLKRKLGNRGTRLLPTTYRTKVALLAPQSRSPPPHHCQVRV